MSVDVWKRPHSDCKQLLFATNMFSSYIIGITWVVVIVLLHGLLTFLMQKNFKQLIELRLYWTSLMANVFLLILCSYIQGKIAKKKELHQNKEDTYRHFARGYQKTNLCSWDKSFSLAVKFVLWLPTWLLFEGVICLCRNELEPLKSLQEFTWDLASCEIMLVSMWLLVLELKAFKVSLKKGETSEGCGHTGHKGQVEAGGEIPNSVWSRSSCRKAATNRRRSSSSSSGGISSRLQQVEKCKRPQTKGRRTQHNSKIYCHAVISIGLDNG